MSLKNIILILIFIIFISLLITMDKNKPVSDNIKKTTIATSTFSLYDIVKNIANDNVDLFMILPFGVDAHSYEPTPKQVIKLHKSDLVIYSGAGLEPWISGFEFQNRAIDISLHVKLKELDKHEHCNGNHHEHIQNFDPHYWLDIQNMIIATKLITRELIKLSPKNKELYIKNKDIYIEKLKNLDKNYKNKLAICKLNTIVVNHNAFSYLSSKYDFKVKALSGFSPEVQPSAKNMANLIEYVKEYKISTIFFESFVSDKAIKSIANEAKVNVDVLQPLGNITADEANQKLTYEDIMKSNLEKISKALECQ
ncbi:MAG: metal ABC transporter substrate-binding protein [Sulfurimonas sp.]|nr:metal ABC transporter substrate-binding protein [Sulfurimonas sp.]